MCIRDRFNLHHSKSKGIMATIDKMKNPVIVKSQSQNKKIARINEKISVNLRKLLGPMLMGKESKKTKKPLYSTQQIDLRAANDGSVQRVRKKLVQSKSNIQLRHLKAVNRQKLSLILEAECADGKNRQGHSRTNTMHINEDGNVKLVSKVNVKQGKGKHSRATSRNNVRTMQFADYIKENDVKDARVEKVRAVKASSRTNIARVRMHNLSNVLSLSSVIPAKALKSYRKPII
eukprot:TRINITY_DN2009_c0_g1_i9.p1 TRINITY_DN2009_c0_g1~~TRINITY_DN2009_c0_g1_i9.p1  ORF type:complete len:233 (+),score=41.68 TRINITY_DN2009_c0_g1_i9:88-786(+)